MQLLLSAFFIMFLGLIYNVIEQDLFSSGLFLISAAVFCLQALV
jgi:hypothetical protein